jgi:hypothetical protein
MLLEAADPRKLAYIQACAANEYPVYLLGSQEASDIGAFNRTPIQNPCGIGHLIRG